MTPSKKILRMESLIFRHSWPVMLIIITAENWRKDKLPSIAGNVEVQEVK